MGVKFLRGCVPAGMLTKLRISFWKAMFIPFPAGSHGTGPCCGKTG